MTFNACLLIGALMSAAAALLHLAIIAKGASWYRYFGAGETFARAAEQGRPWPHLVTLCIALLLLTCAAYAGAAAAQLQPLPAMRPTLVLITATYLLRGAALLPLLLFAPRQLTPFVLWSSLLCLAIGTVHAVGVALVWPSLAATPANQLPAPVATSAGASRHG